MVKRWAEMAQLFGDWWRAREDRAFLTSNSADGEEAFSVCRGPNSNTSSPFSLSTRPPDWKVFSIGERRSSQLPDALDFRSLTKTLSSRRRTTKSLLLTQVHISKYFSIRVRVSSSYWVCIIVPAVIQSRYGNYVCRPSVAPIPISLINYASIL